MTPADHPPDSSALVVGDPLEPAQPPRARGRSGFLWFLLQRLVFALATLWALSFITFMLGALAPGGPVEIILGQRATAEQVARVKREFNLDRPVLVRYALWLGDAVRGDLGRSFFRNREPVARTLSDRYPVTVRLAVLAALFAAVVGAMLGLAAALKHDTWVDRLCTTLALTGASVPAFVILPLLVLVFALRLRWFPVTYENGGWWEFVLPAIALGTRPAALIARMTRASFLETLGQDYVRTARAKGLGWWPTVVRHAGKNALIPILTVFGTSVGYMLGGSFVVETIFGMPGIGGISVSSIGERDYPMIQAVTLLAAAVFIGVNLVVDILYGLIDPRLRVAAASR
ncbi:MAG TPA: ABC transporter permease [Armatimonadota bacterium]|nr:ABC transporter permease [Armatimonadota bacterium]